jgi:hypothetical protein
MYLDGNILDKNLAYYNLSASLFVGDFGFGVCISSSSLSEEDDDEESEDESGLDTTRRLARLGFDWTGIFDLLLYFVFLILNNNKYHLIIEMKSQIKLI